MKSQTKFKLRWETIETIRRRYRNKRQWLLIEVAKVDLATTTPLTGRLIAHSPYQDDITRKSMKIKGGDLLVDYSEDKLPPNTALIY